jgi:hypothetical protein
MDKDTVIFSDKSFSDVLADIYNTSKKKELQINKLVEQLSSMIKSLNDASLVVPLIKEYLEVSVKNDEHIVRLAAILQRLILSAGNRNTSDEFSLTDEEKRQLMDEAEDLLNRAK